MLTFIPERVDNLEEAPGNIFYIFCVTFNILINYKKCIYLTSTPFGYF